MSLIIGFDAGGTFTDSVVFNTETKKIISSGNVEINFENNYTLKTEEINYLKKTAEVIINYPTKITDKFATKFSDSKKIDSFVVKNNRYTKLQRKSLLNKIKYFY